MQPDSPSQPAPNLARACARVLSEHLDAMRARETGTRDGADIEDLHHMRVSSRRLRAALRVFRGALGRKGRKALNKDLLQIDEALAGVRDLDVLLERIAANDAPLDEVEGILRQRRDALRLNMLEVLGSGRYRDFVTTLRDRLDAHDERLFSGPAAGRPFAEAAGPLLRKSLDRANRALSQLDGDSPAQDLHDARKDIRRLRYTLEFLGPLYGKPAKRLLKQTKHVQDQLGEHQDAIVAQEILEGIRRGAHIKPETQHAIGQVIQLETQHAHAARKAFFNERETWESLCKEFAESLRGIAHQ